MRNLLIFTALLLGLLGGGCRKEVTPLHTLTISLVLPKGFDLSSIPDGTEVKLINGTTGRETTVLTTEGTGVISTDQPQGIYDGSASFSVKSGNDEYLFNGLFSNLLLDSKKDVQLQLSLSKNSGGFLFKEIYFAGSKTPDGKTYSSEPEEQGRNAPLAYCARKGASFKVQPRRQYVGWDGADNSKS